MIMNNSNLELNENQLYRYSRNIILNNIGGIGQKKLLLSKVLVVGAGGLGSPILYYLAATGIGTIGIIDYDIVEISNLNWSTNTYFGFIKVTKFETLL